MRRALLLLLLIGWVGCPKGGRSSRAERLARAIAHVDAAWQARADDGLDPVAQAIASVDADLAEDPALLWRQVRLDVAEGLAAVDPVQMRRRFAEGREAAFTCLDQAPGFTRIWTRDDLARARSRITPATGPCAAWGALAWARWAVTFDERAVTMDLPDLRALSEAAPGGLDAAAREAQSTAALITDLLDDVADARTRLKVYARQGDDPWIRYEDLLRWVSGVNRSPPARTPVTPEAQGARARLSGDASR